MNDYSKMKDLENLVNYAVKDDHCIEGACGAQGLLKGNPDTMYQQMVRIKKYYCKQSGRQAMHLILSFSKEEMEFIGLREAMEIGYYVANYFRKWQIVFSVHTNTDVLHIHFVINTVSYEDGLKISIGIPELQELRRKIGEYVNYYYSEARLMKKQKNIFKQLDELAGEDLKPIPFYCQ